MAGGTDERGNPTQSGDHDASEQGSVDRRGRKRTAPLDVFQTRPLTPEEVKQREAAAREATARQAAAKARTLRLKSGLKLDLGGRLTMELLLIQPGFFARRSCLTDVNYVYTDVQMGGNGALISLPDPYGGIEPDVVVARPVYMGIMEVTHRQWKAVMGAAPRWDAGGAQSGCRVTWEEARAFCAALSKKTGRTVRLPTTAEWEWASRAGRTADDGLPNEQLECRSEYCDGCQTPDIVIGLAWPDAMLNQPNVPEGHSALLFESVTTDRSAWCLCGRFIEVPAGPDGEEAVFRTWRLHDMAGDLDEWCANSYGDVRLPREGGEAVKAAIGADDPPPVVPQASIFDSPSVLLIAPLRELPPARADVILYASPADDDPAAIPHEFTPDTSHYLSSFRVVVEHGQESPCRKPDMTVTPSSYELRIQSLEARLKRHNDGNSVEGKVGRLKKAYGELERLKKAYTLGMSRKQALASMGEPSSIELESRSSKPVEQWRYFIDTGVTFELEFQLDGKAAQYYSSGVNLLMWQLAVDFQSTAYAPLLIPGDNGSLFGSPNGWHEIEATGHD